jgi:predicted PurR-regulated permease PerM
VGGVEVPQPNDSSHDLTRSVLSIGTIGLLIVSSAWIVRPFVTAFLWATVIVISTWPLLLSLQARLWGKRGMATTVMTLTLLLVFLIPLGLSVATFLGHMDQMVQWVSSLDQRVIPPPPEWVAGIPLVGDKIAVAWAQAASQGPGGVTAQVLPYAKSFIKWFAGELGGVASMTLQFLLTVIICGVLYANGETAGQGVRKFAARLAGSDGESAVLLAAATIRGVSIGIVVTALIQVFIAGIGLVIVSMPGALVLSVVILFLCLAQLGPALVMIPAVIFEFYTGSKISAFVLLPFALVSMTIDNVIRPILIRKGADLPLLLIFSGVIGGMISIGILGLFLGPVILAVTYNLLKRWVENRSAPDEEADSGALRPTMRAAGLG